MLVLEQKVRVELLRVLQVVELGVEVGFVQEAAVGKEDAESHHVAAGAEALVVVEILQTMAHGSLDHTSQITS